MTRHDGNERAKPLGNLPYSRCLLADDRGAPAGTILPVVRSKPLNNKRKPSMNAIIYLVGLVVVVMFILSLIGLR